MRKKLGTAAAIAVAGALALAGCGGGGNAQSGAAEGAGGSSQVTIWTLTQDGTQREAWDALVAAFNVEYPDIKVVTEERSVDAHKDAMRQAAGTDALPDIYRYWGGPGLGGELVRVGASADISSLYDEYGWEEFLSGAALANATQYGGHHGVPMIQANEAIFYNKALFAEAGITETPKTWDELEAAAEKLLAAGITPIEFGGTVNWHVMRLLDNLIETNCGAETADNLTSGDGNWAEEPCVTESFEELQRWGETFFNTGYMGISNDDSSQLFYTGQAAMALEGDWFGPQALDGGMNPEDVGVFQIPTGTGRAYGFGELLYVTPQGAENPSVGKFLDFMLSPEGQEALGTAFANFSVNTLVEAPDGTFLADEWTEVISNTDGLYINNDQNFDTAETTEFWRIQNAVLTGGLNPADAGAEFQKFLESNR